MTNMTEIDKLEEMLIKLNFNNSPKSSSAESSFLTVQSDTSGSSFTTAGSCSPQTPVRFPLNSKHLIDESLSLNFDYRHAEHSSSESSMDECGEGRRISSSKSFPKFIPLPAGSKCCIPKLELNKRAPSEWRDCQDALVLLQSQAVVPAKNSLSDSGVEGTKQKQKAAKKSNKFVQLYRRASRKLSRRSLRSLTKASRAASNGQRPTEARLRESTNRLFIQANCNTDPSFNAVLYVEAPEDDDLLLCHAMTELATTAMLSFFHPSGDIRCYWVRDLQSFILEELEKAEVRPKFTRIVYLRRFKAMLSLSRDASNLLRHRDTCFLHSIAAALQISFHSLLVVQDDKL